MMTPLAKRLLGSTCALLLTASLSAPADGAFFNWYGYGSGYGGYATYYGGLYGYGASCGGCGSCSQCCGYQGYSTAYRGYAYYAPSYSLYAPSYCGSACGTSCGTSCAPCGQSCGGLSCGSCGLSSCSGGCGIASIGCGTDCTSGSQPAVGETTPKNDPYIEKANPSTYKSETPGGNADTGGFSDPVPAGRNSSSGQGGGGSGGNEVLPAGSGGGGGGFDNFDDGALFNQGVQKPPVDDEIEETIKSKSVENPAGDDQQPADHEPSIDDTELGEPDTPKDAHIRPLDLKTELARSVAPDRRRAFYSVRFHAPQVARLDVKPSTKWTPVDSDTKLAATE
ncbi:MAG: hypothetical protein KDA93_18975 [Planctomycetaceae bacterium]|nr:hypothetical protein [Planctomycetaceae bacterium]